MLKLNEELRKHGYIYPDDPASYPCSLVGGRIGTSGWSLIGARYGHTRDLVISFEIVLPSGEIIRVGDGGGREGAQVLQRLPAQASLHGPPGNAGHRHRSHPRARQAARGGVLSLLRLPGLHGRVARDGGARTLRGGDAGRRRALRRVEARLSAARRRGLHSPTRVGPGRHRLRLLRERRRGQGRRQAAAAHRQGVGRRLPRR